MNGDLLGQLALEEYKAIRSESAQAKGIQQTIVQWSLGAVAVLGAGVAALFSAMANAREPNRVFPVIVVLLGGVIPIVSFSAFAVWCGELQRMERAGYYLRARERAWSAHLHRRGQVYLPDAVDRLPAVWESFLVSPGLPQRLGKNRGGTIGIIALYALAPTLSIGAAWAVTYHHDYAPHHEWLPHLIQACLAFYVIPAVLLLYQLNEIRRIAGTIMPPDAVMWGMQPDPQPSHVVDALWNRIDVVLPILNEAPAIPWVLSRVPPAARVIAVDNGSSDDSIAVLERFQAAY